MWTPNDIQILIHCYTSPDPHPRRMYPAVDEALRLFESEGIIKQDPQRDWYLVTPRGEAWLEAILSVPMPPKTSDP